MQGKKKRLRTAAAERDAELAEETRPVAEDLEVTSNLLSTKDEDIIF